MTPEQAYDLAKFQRPGVVLCVGAEDAYEKKIAQLSHREIKKLPGDWSWEDRCFRYRLGFVPSPWSKLMAGWAACFGHVVSDIEWKWLNAQSTSLRNVDKWIESIKNERKETT